MNPEVVKLRKNNNSYSVGIPLDIAKDLEKSHFDNFLLHCQRGVITLTPTALLNERLENKKTMKVSNGRYES